jgi:hypothetical protein
MPNPIAAFTVSIGREVEYPNARVIALWWDAKRVPDRYDVDLKDLLRKVVPTSAGVYAITGRHDAHSGPAVLYIGEADQGKGLRRRIPESVSDHLSEKHPGGETLFSDVWDLTIRWARVDDDLVLTTQSLLVISHSPPFNSQSVRRRPPTADELPYIVMNAGRKGPLLPIVAGAYQAPWRDRSGKKLGPDLGPPVKKTPSEDDDE